MAKFGGQATVFGGLRVWAEIICEKGHWDEPPYSIVDEVYWLKRNGEKGKPFSKKLWERLDKDKNWQDYVIDEVFDYHVNNQPEKEKVQLND